ncbi:DUF262 domain-containing HNH endonuclease family protein [Clostridium sp. SHJSY1]|uniref:DUF262 domain-containing protein n=1 Tax=Clostridium sp. SHJSY1 TaxID=2942483 RepID=UPI002874AF32|nr:DUF262 domain-containing protein [Clostridium sp. SHJSY1]MDS0525030.1 DUF262 domain-containing HNH endonuclease family protein [Clostridium sp. SHJSY1]
MYQENKYKYKILDLLSLGDFDLHLGQRRYTWSEELVKKLLEDIDKLDKSNEHPIGTIEVREYKNKYGITIRSLIDGQQRSSVLLLIISEIASKMEFFQNVGKIDEEIERYKNYKEMLEQLMYSRRFGNYCYKRSYKLNIYKNDQPIFRKLLFNEQIKDSEIKTVSHEKLINAKKLIAEYLKKFDGEELILFMYKLLNQITVIMYSSPKEEDPYESFRRKNANKETLDESDHVRNIIFKEIDDGTNESYEIMNLWEEMVNKLTPSKIESKDLMTKINTNNFLKYYIMSKGKYVNKSGIPKYFENLKMDCNEMKNLVKELDKKATKYIEFLKGIGNKSISDIKKLRVTQTTIVLISAIKLSENDINEISELLEKISFCSAMGEIKPNKLERFFTEVAGLIENNKINSAKEKLKSLIEESKEAVVNTILNKSFTTAYEKKKVKYILNKIATALDGGDYSAWDLEHIMLEKRDFVAWAECSQYRWFKDESLYNNLIGKIGNMTLLTRSDNVALKKKSYNDKCEVYKKISCRLTSSIAGELSTGTRQTRFDRILNVSKYIPSDEWGKDEINNRGIWLTNLINYIWFDVEDINDMQYIEKSF